MIMNDNPYKTPESDIETDSLSGSKNQVEPQEFYVVSIKKFTILFFSTMGAYSLYWFYKNWRNYKDRNGNNIWPVWRGIFSIFFAHSLFNEVKSSLAEKNHEFIWNPGVLALFYVILSIASQILDRAAMKQIGSPITDILSLLVLPLIYLTLLTPQKAINKSQDDPDGSTNRLFTGLNYMWIALFSLAWVGTLFGLSVTLGLTNLE